MLHFKCIIPNTGKTVNNRTHSLRDILRMVVIDSVINTVPGGLTLDPVRMHCPSWDEAVVYRQDAAKRQTGGIKFIYRPKIRFFGSLGRLVEPIHLKHGRADGHVNPLGCAKFHLNRHRGWECMHKNIFKKSTFW